MSINYDNIILEDINHIRFARVKYTTDTHDFYIDGKVEIYNKRLNKRVLTPGVLIIYNKTKTKRTYNSYSTQKIPKHLRETIKELIEIYESNIVVPKIMENKLFATYNNCFEYLKN